MKILIIAPAWVGDMVMAQSLFRFLKSLHPDLTIDLVAPPSTVRLAQRMPQIQQAHVLNAAHGGLQLSSRFQLARVLSKQHYDQAIVLPNSWKSALIPWLARIPLRTGWLGEMRYGLLNDWRVLDKAQFPLMIQRFCALGRPADRKITTCKTGDATERGLQATAHRQVPFNFDTHLPWPHLTVDPLNQEKLEHEHSLNSSNVLIICPGAEYGPSKRWPAENFAAVAKTYKQRGGEVWILGGAKDASIATEIQEKTGYVCKNLVGKTSLTDAVDLLALAKLVVTNDSGLMHVAAAVGAKIIAIYGSTSPDFTPPLTEKATIVGKELACRPCFARTCRFGHYHCLTQIRPKEILEMMGE